MEKQKVKFPVNRSMTDRDKLNLIVMVVIVCLLIFVFMAFAAAAWNYFQDKQLSEVL